jgi:hypothetical protein
MALPAGIKTVTLTAGPYTDHTGEPIRGSITFRPSVRTLVWAATGTPLMRTPITVDLVQGAASVTLPATDQDGFLGGSVPVIDWVYDVTVDLVDADAPIPIRVALPQANTSVDLDLLQPFLGETDKSVYIPNVLSVNGKTGAVVLDIPKAMRLDPRSFGAKGDGVTDDTAALQACIDQAMTMSGSSIEIHAGTFLVTNLGIDYSLAKWPTQAISGAPYGYAAPSIIGQGIKKTIIKQKAGATGDLFVVSGKVGTQAGPANNNKVTGAELADLELLGNKTGGHGLRIRSLVNSSFKNLWVSDAGKSGIYFERETFVSGVNDEYSYSNTFTNVKVKTNGRWGIECSGSASIGGTFYDVEAINNTLGGWLVAPTNMALHGCQAIGNGKNLIDGRGLLAIRNTNSTSVNSTLILDGFRSEGNSQPGGFEIEIAAGIGYEVSAPAFYATTGASCLGIGLRGLGGDGYVQALTVTGGYYGITTNTYPDQKAIVLGSDARDTVIKGGRYNFQGTLNTVESVVVDGGFRTSVEHPSMVRFGANGVLSLMRSLTTNPGGRGGEAQLFQRVNANSKIEVCVKMPTGDPIVLATQA